MLSSLRFRLWLSYAFIIVTALSVVTIVLFVSLFRDPFLYRRQIERLNAVQLVLVERAKDSQSPPLNVLADRSAQTFEVRVILFASDRAVAYDTSAGTDAAIGFPGKRSMLRSLPVVRDEKGRAWLYSMSKLADGSYLMAAAPRPRLSVFALFSDEFMPVIFFGGIVALLLSLIAAFLISGWIAAPLQEIVNAAREMPSAQIKPVALKGPREVQELTRAFNSMTMRVQASQKSQREFVANVSHEIKTPLTSIQGFAQALLDGTADDEEARRKAARIIHDESDRMHRMATDLLDLARLDAGTADLKMAPVNMRALLVSVAEKFAPQSRRAEARVEVDAPDDLPLLIADGDRLAQVFTNLTDNALKFAPRGGTVSIRARVESGDMRVEVSDTGAGISEEELAHVFQRFYQADPARRGGGAGLGLAIAHEIAAAHGGRISARSRSGAGATMEVVLPLFPRPVRQS